MWKRRRILARELIGARGDAGRSAETTLNRTGTRSLMYVVLGTIRVKSEHLQEFVEQVREHARRSVREPGCLRFDVLQDTADPQTICLYEVFRTEADLDAHRRHEYYERWMQISRGWREAAPYSRRVLEPIYPSAEEWQ
jgi:autoinducer 2-degrading protein